MTENLQPESHNRIVQPPVTELASQTAPVISVELEADEEIEWLWTHLPNGQSVVTGYEVSKKDGSKKESKFNED